MDDAPVSVAAPHPAPRTRALLGLDFADMDVAASAAWLAARDAGAAFDYVVTPNADHLVRLAREPALLPLYADALLCLLDSRVVSGFARRVGLRPPTVTTGSDLTAALLRSAVRPGERVTIVGLRERHLAALIAATGIAPPAHYDPPMAFDRDPAELARAVRFVRDNPARFVFLAVGSPRQERLAAAIKADGGATGTGLCVGASLEFLAGAVPRAPRFMQDAGIEWLHRLASDPGRMAGRYLLRCPRIFYLLWRERRGHVLGRATA